MKFHLSKRTKIILSFSAMYFVWGSTYLGIKFGLESFPPFFLGGIRFLSAGLILLAFTKKEARAEVTPRHVLSAAILGGLLMYIGNGSVNFAIQTIPSGLAAILVGTEPFWIVIILWMLPGGKRPNSKVVLGLILGFIGIISIFGVGGFVNIGPAQLTGSVVIIAATVSWAFGSLYTRNAPQPSSQKLFAAMQFLFGGSYFLTTSYFLGEINSDRIIFDFNGIAAVTYLSLIGTAVTYTAYQWLMKNVDASKVSTYAYVNPVIAVFLGWLLAGETLSTQTLIGTVIIIFAVFLITSFKRDKKLVVGESG